MRLAVMLGEVNVDAMLRRITAKQFLQWELFGAIEPFGDSRRDWGFAQVAAMVHNVAVAKKDQKPVSKFLLKFEEQTPQTLEDKLAIVRLFVGIHNHMVDQAEAREKVD